ncbi:MAG TPA: beta-ketoacyl-[acyl-carrier-protein] synthase family protein [Chloroflexia bacterium]|jgi:3-oxoacyl-(acyl-carrier-protein) synthase
MERVVITGCGVVSPLGCTVAEFWSGLLEGRSGVVDLDDPEFAALPTRIGARVVGLNEAERYSSKELGRMSRSSLLALVAAEEAVASANLVSEGVDASAVGVVVGSSIGGYSASDGFFKDYYLNNRTTPMIIPVSMNIAPGSNLSIRYGFGGPLLSVDAACATAAQSIGYAFNLIRAGAMRIAVTGGTDSPFTPGVLAAWCAMRAMSRRNDCPAEACRPFSADRDGLVLGEGAGIIVLESESSALERGSTILAEVRGYGASADSHHLTQPIQSGSVRAMRNALSDAMLEPGDIDYINAHGTGTKWNDRNETAAIKEVFGPHAYEVPVVGNKAALGHSIAASGALELIGCTLSICDQVVPPTINYRVPDPECDLDYVTQGSRPAPIRNVISNSFAFGGSNACLVISEYIPGRA